ncbi:flagellar basal body P-ring protein FlgI [Geothrix sp. 21YS21S-2]|uniref:flagellar basal body P-ring protein FlgI n=1 Tax=Geothrix sp. 21YS21S-2 TaxID=3068893 RepID=UPI0027B922A3|nr:flagellar basal body P-ring protein FlgI [Geothrix sp. 21YS21S-2]
MRRLLLLLAPLLLTAAIPDKGIGLPLREVASLQGVRGNMLMGYGLVVGLKGTGDTIQSKFTIQSLANLMARQGISIPTTGVNVKNVASVIVTAELPAFGRPGQRVDVTVSSNGDSSSLAGGTLLMTPLQGPDGQVYVVAQGSLLVGGFSVATAGASNTKNHPTAGRIPEGGLVEREVGGNFNDRKVLRYSLLMEDFTTAVRVVKAINQELPSASARALDARTIEVPVPSEFQGRIVELVARLENLQIELQSHARVVVNEKTGTVIMGSDVRIGAVSIVQAGLSISVTSASQVSQPRPLSKGKTATTTTGEVKAEDEKVKSLTLEPGTTVGRLAEMLNNVGVTPRDLVAILQAMKDAGALNAELRVL